MLPLNKSLSRRSLIKMFFFSLYYVVIPFAKGRKLVKLTKDDIAETKTLSTQKQNSWTDIDVVNIADFGAVGDGISDDTLSISEAIATKKSIIFDKNKIYLITKTLVIDGAQLDGKGAKLLALGSQQVFVISSGSIKNLKIDGNNEDHSSYPTELIAGKNVVLFNITYMNFHGKSSFQTYCLRLPLWGCDNFIIENLRFENIRQNDNGLVAGKGFVGGIYMNSEYIGSSELASNGIMTGIIGRDIYSVCDHGISTKQDADLIRFYWDEVNGDVSLIDWLICISNVKGINVGKRLIKSTGINGCKVDQINCIKDDAFNDMYSIITLSGGSSRWTITNVTGTGKFARGIELAGEDNHISDVELISSALKRQNGVQFGSSSAPAKRNIVKNINVKGFSIGVYFYDADSCEAENIYSSCPTGISAYQATLRLSKNIIRGVKLELGGVRVDEGANLDIRDMTIDNFPPSRAYPINCQDGNLRIKGLKATINCARRIVNLAHKVQQTVELDDVVIIRDSDDGAIQNDHCILTSQGASQGAILKLGRLTVISNANPKNNGRAIEGRQLVLLKNVNYTIDVLTIINNAVRNATSNDLRIVNAQGNCKINKLHIIQNVPCANVIIEASTGVTKIFELDIQNNFKNLIEANVENIVVRDGAKIFGTV